MWAECKGSKHKPARFHVDKGKKDKDDDDKGKDKNKDRDDDYGDKDKGKKDKKSKRSFNAYPDTVTRGDKVWVEGTGCKKYASVSIKLNGKTVKRTHADKWGTFDKLILLLPSHPQPDPLLRPGPLPMPRTKGDGFDTQAKLSCRLRPGCSLLSRARAS